MSYNMVATTMLYIPYVAIDHFTHGESKVRCAINARCTLSFKDIEPSKCKILH